jgi:hypothetical protein
MNCPFCDESIHPGSRFCPKCGLPLKEDSTVMGAYVTDDAGFNPWAIGAGALGIVVVALVIGWATGRKEPETVRREPVGSYSAPARPSYAQFGNGGGLLQAPSYTRAATLPAFTPNIPVKWAWTPPPAGQRAAVPEALIPAPEPQAPPVPLLEIHRAETRQPVYVRVVQPVTPEIPVYPTPQYFPSLPMADAGAAPVQGGEAGVPHFFDESSPYVWDPIHERWALRSDWRNGRPTLNVRPAPPAGRMQNARPQSGPAAAAPAPLDGTRFEGARADGRTETE